MTQTQFSISVIICAYTEGRWDDLCAAVESVRRQTFPAREIIVVVDHNPELLERVHAQITGVVAIENKDKPGASGSRNTGVAISQGEIIAFLDDDATAEPDWLLRLHSGYKDPKVLGVGGMLIPVWVGGRPAWFPSEFNWVVGCTYTGLPEAAAPVRNLIAANMSVRREVFDVVGGFRSGYGNNKVNAPARSFWIRSVAGDEETEFCIQALRHRSGGVWLYLPQAQVRHKVPVTRSNFKYYLGRCYDEGVGKAMLSRLVGAHDGLASERAYTFQTLPRGVLRNLGDAMRGGQGGVGRAGAIIVGLVITVAGYVAGKFDAQNRPSARLESI